MINNFHIYANKSATKNDSNVNKKTSDDAQNNKKFLTKIFDFDHFVEVLQELVKNRQIASIIQECENAVKVILYHVQIVDMETMQSVQQIIENLHKIETAASNVTDMNELQKYLDIIKENYNFLKKKEKGNTKKLEELFKVFLSKPENISKLEFMITDQNDVKIQFIQTLMDEVQKEIAKNLPDNVLSMHETEIEAIINSVIWQVGVLISVINLSSTVDENLTNKETYTSIMLSIFNQLINLFSSCYDLKKIITMQDNRAIPIVVPTERFLEIGAELNKLQATCEFLSEE